MTIIKAVVLVILACVLIALAPWLLFWSVETMTGFVIPLTIDTWFAAVLFCAILRGK